MDIKEFTTATLKQRAEKLAAEKGWSVARFQKECGLSNAFFANVKKISPKTAQKIRRVIPNANIEFLNTGVGPVFLDKEEIVQLSAITVPLLPTTAQGGLLNEFEAQIENYDCEMIVSPIRDATMAITVVGDSMSPEYPNGSRVLVKRIDDNLFIEWGRTYVLDTKNGTVIKNVHPCADEEYVICRSVNQNYEEFRIKKTDIRGWYRVLLQMALK